MQTLGICIRLNELIKIEMNDLKYAKRTESVFAKTNFNPNELCLFLLRVARFEFRRN